MAIVLLLFAGMAMPVAAEEMQAEDTKLSIGGYDEEQNALSIKTTGTGEESIIENSQEITFPEFLPTILDKVNVKPEISKLCVNTGSTEFIGAIFTQTQINRADQNPDPDLITISLPKDQILIKDIPAGSITSIPTELDIFTKSGDVRSATEVTETYGIKPVLILWMPKELIDPVTTGNNFTITFPKDFLIKCQDYHQFKKKAEEEIVDIIANEKVEIDSEFNPVTLSNSIFYQERAVYKRDSSYSVKGVTGILGPYSYRNDASTFTSYHEIEIYLNGRDNTAEFISHIRDDGSQRYWAVIWDDGSYYTMLDVTVDDIPYYEYYFFIADDIYWFYFRNPVTGTYTINNYDDSDDPATGINWLMASTELYLNSKTGYFKVQTKPIREDWTLTSNDDWYSPAVTFDWDHLSQSEKYVAVSSQLLRDGRIQTTHIGGSSVS